jgi:ATP-dependent DNA ligase
MLWRVSSRPVRSRLKPAGFILPCQPALADRPPSGPGWLHEIKFDGYRVIARKDGEQVRLWARTTSDYSKAFTRIRDPSRRWGREGRLGRYERCRISN